MECEEARVYRESDIETTQDALRLLRQLHEGQARMEAMLGELCGRSPYVQESTAAPASETRFSLQREESKPILEAEDRLLAHPKLEDDNGAASDGSTSECTQLRDTKEGPGTFSLVLDTNRQQVSRLQLRDSAVFKTATFIHLSSDVEIQVMSALSDKADNEQQARCMLHPESPSRFWLDILAFIFLLYDSIEIPLRMSWDIESLALRVIEYISCAFWGLDLMMGFFVGYHDDTGRVVKCRSRVAKHYLKTTFVPFSVAVLSDFIPLVVATQEDGTFLEFFRRFAWLTRIVRIVTLVKFGRPTKVFDTLVEYTRRWFIERQFVVTIRILNMFAIMLWLGHLFACLWRVFGAAAISQYYAERDLQEMERDVGFDYSLAFFWAMSVMIAGSSITQPVRSAELIFTTFCMLVGLVVCSVVIGVIADTLAESRDQNKEWREQILVFRKYLRQSDVPPTLSLSLEKQVLRRSENPRVLEENVKLLEKLSPSTREILQAVVFRPVVLLQRFIRACEPLSSNCVINICSLALEREVLPPGRCVFERGGKAVGAYLVHWGCFEYLRPDIKTMPQRKEEDGESEAEGAAMAGKQARMVRAKSVVQTSKEVDQCTWLCELALFCDWEHYGSMRAVSSGEALKLLGDKLLAILKEDTALADLTTKYAKALCEVVKDNPDASFDLRWPALHEEVLLRLLPAHRSLLSTGGLDALSRRGRFSDLLGVGSASCDFARDVDNGKCDIVVETSKASWNAPLEESVLRMVSIAVLQLVRKDGLQLAIVGRLSVPFEGAPVSFEPGLKLPGETILREELPLEAIGRLLAGELSEMKDAIASDNTKVVEEVRMPSARYKIPTKYVRHVFGAVAADDWQDRCTRYMLDLSESRPTLKRTASRLSDHSASSFRAHGEAALLWEVVESFPELFVLDDAMDRAPKLYAWMPPERVRRPELAEGLKDLIAARGVHLRQEGPGRVSVGNVVPTERRVYEV